MRGAWRGLLWCGLLGLTGCTLWGAHPAKNFSEATGGEGLERVFWKEVQEKQWDELARHLASNYIYVTPAGRLDREAALQQFKQFDLKECSLGDIQVELNGSTFVVSYSVTLRGMQNGQPLTPDPQRRVSVWQQQKAGWVAIAHTVVGTEGK